MGDMLELEFKNPEFRYDEVNITVRLGTKWADGRIGSGDVIRLVEHNSDRNFGEALVLGYFTVKARQLAENDAILEHEHDEECKTWAGLEAELKRVYGLDEIDPGTFLTIIVFEPAGGPVIRH